MEEGHARAAPSWSDIPSSTATPAPATPHARTQRFSPLAPLQPEPSQPPTHLLSLHGMEQRHAAIIGGLGGSPSDHKLQQGPQRRTHFCRARGRRTFGWHTASTSASKRVVPTVTNTWPSPAECRGDAMKTARSEAACGILQHAGVCRAALAGGAADVATNPTIRLLHVACCPRVA